MSGIFGALNLNDTDRVFQATQGQQVIYDVIQQYINRVNADIMQATSVFVSGTTENYKERFKLPGGGYLQRRGRQSQAAAVKVTGGWDVAYPLEDFGAQVSSDDVSMAYMTVADLNRHVQDVALQNATTVRFEMLKAIFNSAQDTFSDPLWGSLSIEPLANGDAVTYPPVLGTQTEATENHYLESGYAATAISDTNDPYVTIANELEEHFGTATGGSNIAVFINNAETPETLDLTDFTPVTDMSITPGNDTATVNAIPSQLTAPAATWRVLGRHDGSGVWVVEWRWIPANYAIGVHLEMDAPLKMRVDPTDTGLGTGLQLVSNDATYPFESSHWRHRFGFGCGNRLNGVVMEFGTGGTYTVPTDYA